MDDAAKLAWLRQVYFALDGRWYLKTTKRVGADLAQEVNDAVVASVARTQLRVWCELNRVDTIDDCRMLGRFVLDLLDVLYGSWEDAVDVVTDEPDEPDEWAMQHVACTIFEMGRRAGYQDEPVPGTLPGCGGLRTMAASWATAAGAYRAEQRPALSPQGGVACRYVFTRA